MPLAFLLLYFPSILLACLPGAQGFCVFSCRSLEAAEAEAQRKQKEADNLVPKLKEKKQALSPLEKEVNDTIR